MNEQSLCSVCLFNWVEVKYVVLASGEVELEYVFLFLGHCLMIVYLLILCMCVIYLFWKGTCSRVSIGVSSHEA